MGSYESLGTGGPEENSNLSVRVFFKGKGVHFSVPPVLLVLLLLCGLCSYKIANTELVSEKQRQASKIAELEQQRAQLESLLAHKEKERNQMVALAEARSKELWSELDARDKEISRLWKIVGKKPVASKLATRGTKPRKSLSASRSGHRRNGLAVKVDYTQLAKEFEASEEEMASLSRAARAYRQRKVEEYKKKLASRTPSIRPCKGELTSDFGNRIHPVYGYGRFHGGCDFTTPHGTPIRATAAGVVCHADWLGGYGKVVEIDHGNGLKTLYAHCSELSVKEGQQVEKGQAIAKVGTTGLSSGPHCHYEVRRGEKQIDPKEFF